MQKQRLESKFWHELAYAFWQNGLQKIYLTDAKKLIYQKFPTELSGDKKARFDDDISRIIITNEI